MSCVLRAVGAEFEVDAFLRRSRFSPLKVWRRGDRVSAKSADETGAASPKHGQSGFAALASAASFRKTAQQVSDATFFLRRHEAALSALADCPGVEAILLDFGIEDCPLHWKKDETQTSYFPPELLVLMAKLRIGLVVTRYPETAD
ncbi:hypothetical protein FNU79_08760 [Deinococcus detaillensis]|uniref:Uncharacterized protein n=1 Tax=Deinococcus detaillensis TaxID=2592048 RepID=A0A553V068_9DEIO|nr:hypothetical protein [Deinococcus detaillensis]TSA85866.1 hypothetical protein FNU79_08760 [Deinococcus detaillensis]